LRSPADGQGSVRRRHERRREGPRRRPRQADTHGVKYLRYRVDEDAGRIFCLVEAPDADAAHAVHREAHGLVADEIFQVSEGV
jgi:Protein of unknown function (DUF4242)